MTVRRLPWGWLAGTTLLAGATSCVPAPQMVVQAVPPRERVVAEAAPLLRRLDLQVAPADLPLTSGPRPAIAAAPAILSATRSVDDAQRAIDCMTAAVYYEARSEPLDGQRAVAQVVLNRVADRAFPNSVCGVVYQGSTRSTGCQFSFTCDGSLYRPRDELSWARSRSVAIAALSGSVDPDVGSATHYHTTAILPWWAPSLVRLGVIGHHVFYRWPDALERALGYRQSYAGSEPGTADLAAAAPALADGGVTVHRPGSDAVEQGVSVHRSGAAPAGPLTVAAAAVDAVPSASPALFAGVHVHRTAQATAPDEGDARPSPVS